MKYHTNELWKAEASSRPKQSLQPKNHLHFPERSSSLESRSNLIYFSAPTDRDLGHQHHPFYKTTQPLEKSDPVGLLFLFSFLFFLEAKALLFYFSSMFLWNSLFSITSFSYTCLDGPNGLLYLSFFIFFPLFWSRLYFSTSSPSSQFIDRSVSWATLGSPESPLWGWLVEAPLPMAFPPSYQHRLSIGLTYKHSPESSPAMVQYLSYLQQMVNSFMTLSPDKRVDSKAADTRRARHLCALGGPGD